MKVDLVVDNTVPEVTNGVIKWSLVGVWHKDFNSCQTRNIAKLENVVQYHSFTIMLSECPI